MFESSLRAPAKLLVSPGGVGSQVQDVTSTTGSHFVGEVTADGGGEGIDHLVDSASLTGTQVPGTDTWVVGAEVVEGLQVTVGKVQNVDVVTDGGTVVGLVVFSKLATLLSIKKKREGGAYRHQKQAACPACR